MAPTPHIEHCDWCRKRIVGLGERIPNMRTITVTRADEDREVWRVCHDCDTKFARLRSRLARNQATGSIR